MRTYFSMLLIAATVSFLLTPLAQRLAFIVGAVDRPDPRKIHRAPTARLGGLAVFVGFAAPWAALYLLDNRVAGIFQQNQILFITLIACSFVMFAVGAVDDVIGLSAWVKLGFQVAAAGAMYFGGFRITTLSNPFGDPYQLGWLSIPFTIAWIVGLTNATNLLDGMDGLVTGVAAVLALSLSMINIIGGNPVVALVTFALAGAALGFLPYNFTPARIFLGDSGSLFLGIAMAGISTLSLFKTATATLVLVPFILFGLPLFDTAQVVIGRLRRGQHPFSPDRTHVHHKLLDLGLAQSQATAILYAIALVLGVSAILLSWRLDPSVYIAILTLVGLAVVALVLGVRRVRRRNDSGPPPQPGGSPPWPPTHP